MKTRVVVFGLVLPLVSCQVAPVSEWEQGLSDPITEVQRESPNPRDAQWSEAFYRVDRGLYQVKLIPRASALMVTLSGKESGIWTFQLGPQESGYFEPFCAMRHGDSDLVIAGTYRDSNDGALLYAKLNFAAVRPEVTLEEVPIGPGVGEITHLSSTSHSPSMIFAFDFRYASILAVDLSDSSSECVVSPQSGPPELKEMQSMRAMGFDEDPEGGKEAGNLFTLQSGTRFNYWDNQATWVYAIDYGPDGEIDHFVVE